MKDFRQAPYTAVISDLHLCEAEPVHPKFALWKKYKTREFFFDTTFADFLKHVVGMADGAPVELVLNGDIFDFDSVLDLPQEPPFRVTWLERRRGLSAEEAKSVFKLNRILLDHPEFVEALRSFLLGGHRIVIIFGNHDLELNWPAVQALIRESLKLSPEYEENLRFCEWFYISNSDTLIEHGNQYDPYCVCHDPINPYVVQYNRVEIRLPFGNIACRYMMNGMAFFNPHVDSGYIMSVPEYVRFFVKYMVRAQPFLMWTWIWGAVFTLFKTVSDTLLPALRDPLRTEDRVEDIAAKANATPRMVRELKELFVPPATLRPLTVARELYLDRAFLVVLGLAGLFQLFLFIKQVYDLSFFWMFIPLGILVPFFLFYSRSISSNVEYFKEPQDDILAMTSEIARVRRVIYGHTHIIRHEVIGSVDHLNPGSWSPAFSDIECTKPIGHKSFVWIQPGPTGSREASVFEFREGTASLSRRARRA